MKTKTNRKKHPYLRKGFWDNPTVRAIFEHQGTFTIDKREGK